MWTYNNNDELYHFGIKGMKWGVRRYQNPDGSLTPAGKKKYGNMSNDKLQKNLYKQVKKARAQQSNWYNQWEYNRAIGKHSKAAIDRQRKAIEEYQNSDAYKKVMKEYKKLDDAYDRGKIDADEYDEAFERLRKSVYRSDLDTTAAYGSKGREYSKDYLDSYGRDINIGYLKDLGYDDSTAKEFVDRIMKSNRKMLNGM